MAKDMIHSLLNNPNLREVLRTSIPEVQILEGIRGLEDLSLRSISSSPELILLYETCSSGKYYENLRANLVREGISRDRIKSYTEASTDDNRLFKHFILSCLQGKAQVDLTVFDRDSFSKRNRLLYLASRMYNPK